MYANSYVSIVKHNLSKYDTHFIVRDGTSTYHRGKIGICSKEIKQIKESFWDA